MSVHESDGIAEVFDESIRLAVTAGGRVAEARIRAREQQLRDTQAESQQASRELQNRLDSERAAARAELAPVSRQEWWGHATPADIEHAWETAQTWQDLDPDAQRAAQQIRSQVRERYKIDVNTGLPASPPQPATASSAPSAAAGSSEAVEVFAVLASAERADEAEAMGKSYDTAQRRAVLAEQLKQTGVDPDAAQARELGEISQARPAVDAVTGGLDRAPRARRPRAGQRPQRIQRPERSR